MKLEGTRHYRAKQGGGGIHGEFWLVLPKNRGCTCTPGTPSSYGPAMLIRLGCLINLVNFYKFLKIWLINPVLNRQSIRESFHHLQICDHFKSTQRPMLYQLSLQKKTHHILNGLLEQQQVISLSYYVESELTTHI